MRKLRKQAKELLHASSKVYHYRRDVIAEGRLAELEKAVNEVDRFASDPKSDPAPFEAALQRLDGLLRKIGGKIYPKTFWSDNLEVLLVAAILVIGVRTFFFQPFIIPTNSMYPTYSGMNAVVYLDPAESPGGLERAFRKLTLGASHYDKTAPISGEVGVPIFSQAADSLDARLRNLGIVRFEIVNGRKWFGILPAQKREYTLYIDDRPVTIRVPVDFSLDQVIQKAFFPEVPDLARYIYEEFQARRLNVLSASPIIPTGRSVEAGEPILQFDITLGDALFVDRLSYHFTKPEPGDPFVFRTRDIPGIEGGPTNFVDKYYIKRLGGVGGEILEIRDGALLADGEPRDEAEAFVRNANREDEYQGYINRELLDEGRELSVPEDKFVALGDNSGNSLDSRYWGFVPKDAVIGKALFIYYPFTKRWGPAE